MLQDALPHRRETDRPGAPDTATARDDGAIGVLTWVVALLVGVYLLATVVPLRLVYPLARRLKTRRPHGAQRHAPAVLEAQLLD